MQRRLILFRHAKSSWKSGAVTDHARPLNKRGRRDAPRMAAELIERGWWPQVVLSSDSERTRETWQRMSEGREAPEPEWLRDIYLGGPPELRAALETVPDDVETVMLIGHNPGCEEVLTWLSGAQEPMTTANAALLTTDAPTWRDAVAARHRFELSTILRPKELPT